MILLSSKNVDFHFFQLIEGPEKAIDQLVENIRRDSLHQDMTIFHTSNIQERLLPNWHMHLQKIENATDIAKVVDQYFEDIPIDQIGNHLLQLLLSLRFPKKKGT